MGHRRLGVIFLCPWPTFNGEIHFSRVNNNSNLRPKIKTNNTTDLILDINECEDPAIASRCVQNAECCNLPSHFLCKCKPGYVGDGEVECRGKSMGMYSRCARVGRSFETTLGHCQNIRNRPDNRKIAKQSSTLLSRFSSITKNSTTDMKRAGQSNRRLTFVLSRGCFLQRVYFSRGSDSLTFS